MIVNLTHVVYPLATFRASLPSSHTSVKSFFGLLRRTVLRLPTRTGRIGLPSMSYSLEGLRCFEGIGVIAKIDLLGGSASFVRALVHDVGVDRDEFRATVGATSGPRGNLFDDLS